MTSHENLWHWAHPGVTVCVVAFDHTRKFPLLWRTDKVRSAKNQWSLPTGLHENGKTFAEQAAAELLEELSLHGDVTRWKFVTTYENILFEENFHWVISIGTMPVRSLSELVNKEPDKHSKVMLIDPFDPGVENQLLSIEMGRATRQALIASLPTIRNNIMEVYNERWGDRQNF